MPFEPSRRTLILAAGGLALLEPSLASAAPKKPVTFTSPQPASVFAFTRTGRFEYLGHTRSGPVVIPEVEYWWVEFDDGVGDEAAVQALISSGAPGARLRTGALNGLGAVKSMQTLFTDQCSDPTLSSLLSLPQLRRLCCTTVHWPRSLPEKSAIESIGFSPFSSEQLRGWALREVDVLVGRPNPLAVALEPLQFKALSTLGLNGLCASDELDALADFPLRRLHLPGVPEDKPDLSLRGLTKVKTLRELVLNRPPGDTTELGVLPLQTFWTKGQLSNSQLLGLPTSLTSLAMTAIDNTGCELVSHCRLLRDLQLTGLRQPRLVLDDKGLALLAGLPALERLTLQEWTYTSPPRPERWFTDESFEAFAGSSLTHLVLDKMVAITAAGVKRLGRMKKLRRLSLLGWPALSADALAEVIEALPQLERVDLQGLASVRLVDALARHKSLRTVALCSAEPLLATEPGVQALSGLGRLTTLMLPASELWRRDEAGRALWAGRDRVVAALGATAVLRPSFGSYWRDAFKAGQLAVPL